MLHTITWCRKYDLPKRWHDANMVKKVLSSVFSLISATIRLKMDKGSQQMRKTVTMQIKSQLVLKCVNNNKKHIIKKTASYLFILRTSDFLFSFASRVEKVLSLSLSFE